MYTFSDVTELRFLMKIKVEIKMSTNLSQKLKERRKLDGNAILFLELYLTY